ncbi:hypothetical protein Ancab_027400 [Ancistrocladus abbreviatus]
MFTEFTTKMATYFTSSNDQRDAESTLYSRESRGSYPEVPLLPGNNTVCYMNVPSSSAMLFNGMAGNFQLRGSSLNVSQMGGSVSAASEQEILSDITGSRIGVPDCNNTWRDSGSTMFLVHPVRGQSSMIHGGQNLNGQGLSLSLGTQIPPSIQISSITRGDDYSLDGEREDLVKPDSSRYVMSSMGRIIPNSKYLKAAQQLLNEVVNVSKALKQRNGRKDPEEDSKGSKNGNSIHPSDGEPSGTTECKSDIANDLLPAARHDLQNKLMKLLTMLDEIDGRYRQYYHQMQIVVASFESVAGSGAARPYTALALQTISCHFRCLRDTVSSQIHSTRKTLGDQDTSECKGVRIARLRYVDQQLRQQKALQQLGMMQQTWRPQRGLPESSVSILRAWLFEHFLHPYPKDSEKIMLARRTGLTRSQVSNWFINARVRLWKPMVEEMYKEEAGNAEMDSNSSSDHSTTRATEDDYKPPADTRDDMQQSAPSSTHAEPLQLNSKPDIEMEAPTAAVHFQNDIHQGALPVYGVLNEEQTLCVANSNIIFQSHGGNNYSFMSASIRPGGTANDLASPVQPGWKRKDLDSVFLSLARPNTDLSEPGQPPEQPWDMQFL